MARRCGRPEPGLRDLCPQMMSGRTVSPVARGDCAVEAALEVRDGRAREHTLVRFEVTLDSHESSVSGSASADEQRIERSPADVLRLLVAVGVALALLLVEWLFGDALVDFASELLRGLDAVPAWMIGVFVVGTRILAVVVLGGGLIWALVGRRWRAGSYTSRLRASVTITRSLPNVPIVMRQGVGRV